MCIQSNDSGESIPSSKNRDYRNQRRKSAASKKNVRKHRSPAHNNDPRGGRKSKSPAKIPPSPPQTPEKIRRKPIPLAPVPVPAPEPPVVRRKISRHVAQVLNQTNDLKIRKKSKSPEPPPPPPTPPPIEHKVNLAAKLSKRLWDFMNRDLNPPEVISTDNPLEPRKEPVPNKGKNVVPPKPPEVYPPKPKTHSIATQDYKDRKKKDSSDKSFPPDSPKHENKYSKRDEFDRNPVVQHNEVKVKSKKVKEKVKEEEEEEKKNPIKMQMRKQIWAISKPFIKRNERISSLMKANNIDLDSIRIDKLDLSLIDINQLGIENKALKKSIIWLLK